MKNNRLFYLSGHIFIFLFNMDLFCFRFCQGLDTLGIYSTIMTHKDVMREVFVDQGHNLTADEVFCGL